MLENTILFLNDWHIKCKHEITFLCTQTNVWKIKWWNYLIDSCLTGLHDSHILSSKHPLHPCTHCNTPTSSSQHQHFVMLFGRGRAARVKIRDSYSYSFGVAQPQTTQCSHSVSVQQGQVILVGSSANTLTRTETNINKSIFIQWLRGRM